MGKIASGNLVVGAVLPKDIVAEIDRRRGGQSMTRSKFVGLIVAKWYAEGAPAINDADAAVQQIRELERKTLPPKTASSKRSA